MRDKIRKLISPEVADSLGVYWGADSQGEIPSAGRHSGFNGFWLQIGNFAQARIFSKHLAHQIHMQELGLAPKDAPYVRHRTATR